MQRRSRMPMRTSVRDGMLLVLLTCLPIANGNPDRMTAARLEACATGICATIMNSQPTVGTALTATGKAPGGSYTAGETVSLAVSGTGEYVLYASADGQQLARSDNQPTTVTAPATGTLTLLCIRASGSAGPVVYEKMALTAGGDGGVGGGPPPPSGSPVGSNGPPLPPYDPNLEYISPDGRYTVRWQPTILGQTTLVTVTARAAERSAIVPGWVGFAKASNGEMLGPLGVNIALVALARQGSIQGYLMTGKMRSEMTLMTAQALLQCGVDLATATVSLVGTELTMSFELSVSNSAAPTCVPDQVNTVPALSLSSARQAEGIIVATGATPGLEMHEPGSYMIASALAADGAGTVTSGSSSGSLVLLHGGCMILSWVFLAPAGIMASRFGRSGQPPGKWLRVHKRLVLLASFLTFLAFFFAVGMVKSGHFFTAHAKIGLIFFFLYLVQPIAAMLRPAESSPRRAIWNRAHRILGYSLPAIGMIQCLLGTWLTSTGAGLFFVLFMVELSVIGYIIHKELSFRRHGPGNPSKSDERGGKEMLPAGWSKATDPASGNDYYTNAITGATQWEPPPNDSPQESSSTVPPPPVEGSPWQSVNDPAGGGTYYHNQQTGETSWTKPADFV